MFGDGLPDVTWGSNLCAVNVEGENRVTAGSWFQKSLWREIGGFEPIEFEDWRFWVQCSRRKVSTHHFSEPVYRHRLHPNNLGCLMSAAESEHWALTCKR
jgi:hypothetical protein